VVADELGFDVGWVAQHHVPGGVGGLPSPWTFLASAAARTKRIRLEPRSRSSPWTTHPSRRVDVSAVDTISGKAAGLPTYAFTDLSPLVGAEPSKRPPRWPSTFPRRHVSASAGHPARRQLAGGSPAREITRNGRRMSALVIIQVPNMWRRPEPLLGHRIGSQASAQVGW
jgi:hypothetical protein